MNTSNGFFAMTFTCTSDAICTEKTLKAHFEVSMIPTPREISKSCGFAIRFADGKAQEEEIRQCFRNLEIDSYLYYISEKDEHGKRSAQLVDSHETEKN